MGCWRRFVANTVFEVNTALRDEIGAVLGVAVTAAQPLAGGDINQAYATTFADGRELFVKTNRCPPAGMYEAEARGLRWLGSTGALRVPEVIAFDERFLILELVRTGRPARSFDEDLGRGLAVLHATCPLEFGLDHDNFIGPLAQSNRPTARWSDFYAHQRLEPQLRRATDSGRTSATIARGMRRLLARLDGLVGPVEPPARLHGDLWGGNLMCDERGAPCLIDPAVYAGHREVDLAMMRLFGGFSARTFQAYHEVFPLGDGHEDRVPLYQLYPLLVHLNLFGGSYRASVESALAALV
jgi:fructosamine-3-kinase